MGTLDLDYSDRAPGELLGQLERGKPGPKGIVSDAGHNSEYAQALSEANATLLLAAAEELEG